jgi:hypothetical protein
VNCVILQPSYIPWRGYFHQIFKADIFIFYDDVQYDKNGWRNRNRIKTPNGPIWLTIPVRHRGNVSEQTPICEIRIDWSKDWSRKHWATLQQSYAKAPFYKEYAPLLETFYHWQYEFLADFTINFTVELSRALGIGNRRFFRSSDLHGHGLKTDRLISLLQEVGATHYISGPSARNYLEEQKLSEAGISLEYMTYQYPDYPQLYPPYDPHVSILDLLMVAGGQAPDFIWNSPRSESTLL